MARKKAVEDEAFEGMMVDDTPQVETRVEIPKTVPSNEGVNPQVMNQEAQQQDNQIINCLRKERVIVRFVPKISSMVQNPKHVLFGGMAEGSIRSYVVPRYNSTGMFVNVLTNSEKTCLERVMGLEYNALSIYKKQNNFWDDSNPMGIGRVTLRKQDNYLDLSIPEDYIKYKILLANKDEIAPSMQVLEDKPKATYQFVIINEEAEAKMNLGKVNTKQKCWMEYGKISDDHTTLRVVLELIEGRPISSKVKLDYLQSKVTDYIETNPRRFLSTVTDELLPTKVLIKKCVEKGLIGKKNDAYYLRADGSPLCEINEESTLNNAARYISSVKRQELKYSLEARLKED